MYIYIPISLRDTDRGLLKQVVDLLSIIANLTGVILEISSVAPSVTTSKEESLHG